MWVSGLALAPRAFAQTSGWDFTSKVSAAKDTGGLSSATASSKKTTAPKTAAVAKPTGPSTPPKPSSAWSAPAAPVAATAKTAAAPIPPRHTSVPAAEQQRVVLEWITDAVDQVSQAGPVRSPDPVPAAAPIAAQSRSAEPAVVAPDAATVATEVPAATKASPPGAPALQVQTEPREWFGYGQKWSNWSRMTGDWDRLRTNIEDLGLSIQVATISDVSGLSERRRRSQAVGRQLTTVGFTFDLERIAGLPGGSLLVQYQKMSGANGSFRAADSQGFSNIDADPFSRIGEVWYEQKIGGRFRVKTGLIDANRDFAFVDNGADFINSSMGYSPTIFPLPTYPDPHLGLVVHVDPTDRIYLSAGLFNGGPAMGVADFKALFSLGEVGLRWKGWGGGRIGVGYWRVGGHRAEADDLILPVSTGGEYLVIDQTLWTGERDGNEQSIGAFFQAGLADPRASSTSSHVGGGIVGRGLVARRPDDAIGVGVTAVRLALPTSGELYTRREVDATAFYRFALTKWVALKPDVQLIWYPGGELGRRALLAGTLRIEVGF